MILTSMMKFVLGELLIDEQVLLRVEADEICHAIDRHACGDFGRVSAEERAANEDGLRRGLPVRSMFRARNGIVFCVETTGNRLQTRIFLKEVLP
jgi:hypothetical protein